MDHSPPGSSIHGILQARTLEWVAVYMCLFVYCQSPGDRNSEFIFYFMFYIFHGDKDSSLHLKSLGTNLLKGETSKTVQVNSSEMFRSPCARYCAKHRRITYNRPESLLSRVQKLVGKTDCKQWHRIIASITILYIMFPLCMKVEVLITQSCPALSDPTRLLCPWNLPGKNTRVGCHSLLQGIFLTQGSNLCLLHQQAGCLPLSHQGSHYLDQTSKPRKEMCLLRFICCNFRISTAVDLYAQGPHSGQRLWQDTTCRDHPLQFYEQEMVYLTHFFCQRELLRLYAVLPDTFHGSQIYRCLRAGRIFRSYLPTSPHRWCE